MVLTYNIEELGFDPDALRARYRAERDKRLRPDGIQQFVEPAGDFSHYVEDPYVAPGFTREPLTDTVDVVIVGGGLGGLLAGARLREAGLDRIRVIDKAGDFGGTWYWNRYPGAQCDIESYMYLPLLEETGYVPTEKYAKGPEILAYLQSVGTALRPLRRRLLPDRDLRDPLGRGRWAAGSSPPTATTRSGLVSW